MVTMDDVGSFLDAFPFSPNTRSTYGWVLRLLVEQCEVEVLMPDGLRRFVERDGWGGSQRWTAFCACRSFLRWRFGDTHPALRLRIKREQAGPQRSLKAKQVEALLTSFDTMTVKGVRDLAMCCLLLDTGLRLAEVCRFKVRHVDMDERRLTVMLKGGRWGDAVFSQYTARWLETWLEQRQALVRPGVEAFFVAVAGASKGEQLTRDGLRVVIRRWGEKVGVKLSPHDFRRTFATLAIRNGAPSRVVQVAGRWSSVDMVERYTRAIQAEDFERYSPVQRVME